ncbi:Sec1-binding region of Mso1-domain-containing protein [Paraphoma chrysanthemicola]|uniref:Sec1-binding region of Mso1-domain-containing protein n=1 Tax=Paraphoma chrysanthemicola TaxID=798071 RepID=A0A8K0R9E1_9PLEO|nr:Sec1-binding region of Mso1-domain-containing protein [Paraphoma chrysanthemicola]
MSAYLSNILTNTTSRYTNLRRQLLDSEADGDNEDDSHISRVLRAYYTEKGRPFPGWLPPDPRAPQPAPTQFASSGGRQQGQAPPMGGRGGGLSDLWDNPQQQQQQEPLSLRRNAGGRGGAGRPLHGRPGAGSSLTPEPQSQGRPLPSQRAGSYQSSLGQGGRPQADASPPPSAGSGTTAQERLKARLWGRSNSPASGASADTGNPSYARPGSYERPAPQGGRAPYQDSRNNSYGSTGSGGARQQGSSGMSSNSPWVGNDDPYGPGYDSGPPQRGPAGGRVGLPSGPRMR